MFLSGAYGGFFCKLLTLKICRNKNFVVVEVYFSGYTILQIDSEIGIIHDISGI